MPKRYSDLSRIGKYRYLRSLRKREAPVDNSIADQPNEKDRKIEQQSDSEDESTSAGPEEPSENYGEDTTSTNENPEHLVTNVSEDSGNSEQDKVLSETGSPVTTNNEGNLFGDSDDEENARFEQMHDEDSDDGIPIEQMNVQNNQPLYEGAPLSVNDSMLLVMSLMIKHNLTVSCVADIITVLKLHCKPDKLYKNLSLYHFKNYFSQSSSELEKQFYCASCLGSLGSPNALCGVCKKRCGSSYFLRVPIAPQLQSLFWRKGFYESLQRRLTRDNNDNIISDIFDGSVYKTEVAKGILCDQNNLSLIFFFDGVPVFKSSGVGMWPLCLRISELPTRDRNLEENTIIAGLWFGPKKPDANFFLGSFQDEFHSLYQGKYFNVPNLERPIKVRVVLLTGTCDLPAKSLLLNSSQFNGKFGCPTCETKGETLNLPTGGHTHVYPYDDAIKLRTSEASMEYAEEAFISGAPVKGITGPSTLSKLMPDFVNGIAIDSMHCVYEGVVKKLLHLWTDSSFNDSAFTLRLMTPVIDERLKCMKPPKFVHRMTRSISQLCHWKASELKTWFFYYSLPVLRGIMRPDYFAHYELLVSAISLLNSNQISLGMIETADQLLKNFVKDFQELYGLRHCSINIHQLLHLPHKVKTLGPLWVHSCFTFEDLNGKLLNKIHGTTNLDSQMVNSHLRLQFFFNRISEQPEGSVRDFLLSHKKQVKIRERIGENSYSVGSYKHMNSFTGVVGEAAESVSVPNCKIWKYFRLLKNDLLFVSECYNKTLQTESSFATFSHNNTNSFGKILVFLKVSFDCNCESNCTCPGQHYAIVQKLIFDSNWTVSGRPLASIRHLFKCQPCPDVSTVRLQELMYVCFNLDIDGQFYLAVAVNDWELE